MMNEKAPTKKHIRDYCRNALKNDGDAVFLIGYLPQKGTMLACFRP